MTLRSTVLQNFRQLPVSTSQGLGCVVVGPDYAVRKNRTLLSYTPAGASAGWPGLLTGEVPDQQTEILRLTGNLALFSESDNPPTIANGGQSGTSANRILHDAGATIWTGGTRTGNVPYDVQVGDVVVLTDGPGTVLLTTTVSGFAYTSGDANILILSDSLPVSVLGGYFNIRIHQPVTDLVLSSGYSTSTSTVTVNPSLTVSTSRFGSAVSVVSGTVEIDYRALRQDNVGDVTTIDAEADLDTYFDGWEYPESVLGFACARALPPVVSGTTPAELRFMALSADTGLGWTSSNTLLQARRDWSVIVPLTTNTTNLAGVRSMVENRVALNLWSEMFVAPEIPDETVLLSADGTTVTVGQGETPLENRTVTRDGGPTASPFASVVPGDTVTIAGSQYTVETVVSGQTVIITREASAGSALALNAVTHVLSAVERVTATEAVVDALSSQYLTAVFHGNPTWNGEQVDGLFLAAAIGGVRGYCCPQQSLAGVELEAGWGVPDVDTLYASALSDPSELPFTVVSGTTGTVVVRQTNTSDLSSSAVADEATVNASIVAKRYISSQLDQYRGIARITKTVLNNIASTASAAMTYLTAAKITDLGGVISSGSVAFVGQSATIPGTAEVRLDLGVNTTLTRLSLVYSTTLTVI